MTKAASPSAVVVGGGFAGLSVSAYLARDGYSVDLLEKNEAVGGRCSVLERDGYMFDMGPSWYWMPDVFERFFNHFGHSASDFYDLKRLDPGYRIFFGPDDVVDVPASHDALVDLFESMEAGAGEALLDFLREAGVKYEKGINELVHYPSLSVTEFMRFDLLKSLFELDLFESVEKTVGKRFENEKLRRILEFPVYFLGALPSNIPALYTLMNYADLELGTWYPMGGMYEIVKGMEQVAREQGVRIHTGTSISRGEAANGSVRALHNGTTSYAADVFVSGADYAHTETWFDPSVRNYSDCYWQKRVMAPSSLLFYLGVDRELPELQHHNLFFDESFEEFGRTIYTDPSWPDRPLLYVSAASKTDPSVAPAGTENLVVLIPLAPGLEDDDAQRERLYEYAMDKLERYTGVRVRDHVVVREDFAMRDFSSRYNALRGNAYGLANTLTQTALLKPRLKNRRLKNLYYTGQLTVPGPGVPPSIISGEVVAGQIRSDRNTTS